MRDVGVSISTLLRYYCHCDELMTRNLSFIINHVGPCQGHRDSRIHDMT